jgi:hypothetical protein
VALLALVLLPLPLAGARAQSPSQGATAAPAGAPQSPAQPPPSLAARAGNVAAIAVDLLIARPLLTAATAVGAVLFVPTALVSAPQGRHGLQEAWEMLVVVPADNAFRRPLGEF